MRGHAALPHTIGKVHAAQDRIFIRLNGHTRLRRAPLQNFSKGTCYWLARFMTTWLFGFTKMGRSGHGLKIMTPETEKQRKGMVEHQHRLQPPNRAMKTTTFALGHAKEKVLAENHTPGGITSNKTASWITIAHALLPISLTFAWASPLTTRLPRAPELSPARRVVARGGGMCFNQLKPLLD